MTTNSIDSEKTWASICENIWMYTIFFIVYVVAYIQLAFCVGFVVLIIVVAIWVRHEVHSEVQNSAVGFLDHFTGLGLGSQITREFDIRLFFWLLLILLFASGPLYLSWKLYQGLKQNREDYIIAYIITGTMILGVRVWYIDRYEYQHFPEDKTVLYCGLYGIFLVMLVLVCAWIRKFKRLEAEARAESATVNITAFSISQSV